MVYTRQHKVGKNRGQMIIKDLEEIYSEAKEVLVMSPEGRRRMTSIVDAQKDSANTVVFVERNSYEYQKRRLLYNIALLLVCADEEKGPLSAIEKKYRIHEDVSYSCGEDIAEELSAIVRKFSFSTI